MHFCYVDESGDAGFHDPANPDKTGSRYFILTGMIIPVNQWKASLNILKNFRKKLASEALLNYDVEFHCTEIVDNRIPLYSHLNASNRWLIIKRMADTIADQLPATLIAVVIDKTVSRLASADYLTSSITAIYQAFDAFLQAERSHGIVLFDRANERHATTHVRKLMQTGATGQSIPGVIVNRVIEDPIYRVSKDSMFIQAVDTIAFTLKEHEFPIGSRKKFNANMIFPDVLRDKCLESTRAGEDRLIRL